MGFERLGARFGRDGGGRRRQRMAGDEDVVVCGAATFCGDDMGVVFGGDLVDDAYEAFVPVGILLLCGWEEGGFFILRGYCFGR